MDNDKKCRFNLSEIGTADRRILFSSTLDALNRFYADPANIEKYERWKQQEKIESVG